MTAPRLFGISGALRRASTNTLLLHEAARLFGPCDFALADIDLPLFNADLEANGMPPGVRALIDGVARADAVLIATPEYNKNLPGALKNALDWISREKTDGKSALAGKPVAIMSSAAGRAGGERAQYSLRHCLTPFNPQVLQGPEMFVANAAKAFDDNGRLLNGMSVNLLTALMAALGAKITLIDPSGV